MIVCNFFMFLLTARIVKNSYILTGIYHIFFLKNLLDPSSKSWAWIPNLDSSEKMRKVVRQNLAFFRNLVPPILN